MKIKVIANIADKGYIAWKGGITMDNKTKRKLLAQAEQLGKEAFLSGKKAVAGFDSNLTQLMQDLQLPISELRLATKMYKAWNKGWHFENANQPFDFENKGD